MVRAATADELIKLRGDGQKSDLYLAIHKPAQVFAARVDQAVFGDPVSQITYDGGSGTLADVLPGMTMYVGTSAGAHDQGMARVRAAPTGTIFYIGETSEIEWADNLYLTVVREFGLWERRTRMTAEMVWMDYDVAYSDQHQNCDPYPVLGPHAVLWLTGESVEYEPDASGSWVIGSAISAYLWDAPGASATSGMDTATPLISYDAPGQYQISCKITAASGKTATGYRIVFVFSDAAPPVTQFELRSCAGDYQQGGWSFAVRMVGEAALADARDRTLVLLFARDWYGKTEGSIPSNVIAAGWIAGETIEYDPEENSVMFEARGPQHWLAQISSRPVGMEYTASDPTVWTSFKNLTVDGGLWHLLHWHSTASLCMDAHLTGDTKKLPTAEAPSGSLWEQLREISQHHLLAHPCCDRSGALHAQVDTQVLPVDSRGGIVTVMELTQDDWEAPVDIERNATRGTALVELSGRSFDGSDAQPLFSRAPGIAPGRFGTVVTRERLLLADQAECNLLAGLVYAHENNPYPYIGVRLAQNNRLIDIAPRQRLLINVSASDTARGITLTDQLILPRRVAHRYDAETGALLTEIECEGETSGPPGVTVIPPSAEQPDINVPNFNFGLPGFPLIPGSSIWWPPVTPPPITTPDDCLAGTSQTGPFAVMPDKNFLDTDMDIVTATAAGHVWLRPATVIHKSKLVIYGQMEYRHSGVWYPAAATDWWTVTALGKNGEALMDGANEYIPWFANNNIYETTFYMDAATEVWGFKISLLDIFGEPGVYNRNFDFSGGTAGWAFAPLGDTCSVYVPTSNGSKARWAMGQIQVSGLQDQACCGVWYYRPVECYAYEGATVKVMGWYSGNDFDWTSFGVVLINPVDQSLQHYFLNFEGRQKDVEYTLPFTGASAHNKWKVKHFIFHMGFGWPSDWYGLYYFNVAGFHTPVDAIRFHINSVRLYNVCEP